MLPPIPDAVDLVLETTTMMSVYAAQRLVRIDVMRRELLADAVGRGAGVLDIVERSIRLELAAAMRVTEYAAGRLIFAWQHGGETSLENNAPFCKGHHIVKHHGGWTVTQLEGSGGAIEWISPTGRRYVVHPERRVPVFTVTTTRGTGGDAPF